MYHLFVLLMLASIALSETNGTNSTNSTNANEIAMVHWSELQQLYGPSKFNASDELKNMFVLFLFFFVFLYLSTEI